MIIYYLSHRSNYKINKIILSSKAKWPHPKIFLFIIYFNISVMDKKLLPLKTGFEPEIVRYI